VRHNDLANDNLVPYSHLVRTGQNKEPRALYNQSIGPIRGFLPHGSVRFMRKHLLAACVLVACALPVFAQSRRMRRPA
jgi:hypothetical protein